MSAARLVLERVVGEPSDLYQPLANTGQERVVSAAVRDTVTQDVFLGDFHLAARQLAQATVGMADNSARFEDGFLTSEGRFVTRREALVLARRGRSLSATATAGVATAT